MRCLIAITALLLAAIPLYAQDGSDPSFANRQLADPAAEASASALMNGLRCVQCQGQSIADSDAPIAAAMRNEVRQRIAKGENPDAIRDWLVARYGEYISFEPSFSGAALFLWIAPFLILLIAFLLARGLFAGKPG
jgi:cytochrome c-type biogenesis protein CcmH/NrfF